MSSASARGAIIRTAGELAVAALPAARVGDGVAIDGRAGRRIGGVVAAVDRGFVSIDPFESLRGIGAGDSVRLEPRALECVLGYGLLGRAVDARGVPLDGRGPLRGTRARPELAPPLPSERAPIRAPLWSGVPAVDGFLTLGRGARVGLFGPPGCGKSTLLEAICMGARADAVVLALIGERGREAQEWFERLDARTTIVCATSDRSAAERVRAAQLAMAQACTLRERGLHALLVVDSLARFCSAERERRSALGEPAGRGGYPAAVWAELARFLECAGAAHDGSITLVASVLSDGGDDREPLSDNARSLLDGHVVLTSALARSGSYPAIDVLASASRTMNAVVDAGHRAGAARLRHALAILERTRDARSLGLVDAHDAEVGAALAIEAELEGLLRRRSAEPRVTRAAIDALAASFERGIGDARARSIR